MLFPDLQNIKTRRQNLGLGQKELASLSQVSQSLIAKLEKGKIEPSYGIAKKIFLVLEGLEHKKERKCNEVMTKKIVFVKPRDKINHASDVMKKHFIDQLPVLENKRVVGSISESIIFNRLLDTPKNKLFNMHIEEIMKEPYPIVNSNMPLSVVLPLLKSSDALLVLEGKELKGIITRSNLI